MFIKTSIRKHKGKEYKTQYLVKSYRDKKTWKVKHENLLSLSKLPDKLLLALQEALENKTEIEKVKLEDLEIIDIKEYWSIKVLWKIFDKSFWKILDSKYLKELKAIVLNKILDPKSKNALDNWLRQVDLWYRITSPTKKQKLYDSLDYLEDNQRKIEKKILKRAKAKKADVILYDITSTYFEWKWAESICKHWYSRDHRRDRVQVNIWLVTDNKWLPISVEVFEWNIADKSTIKDKVNSLKKDFDIENITFIFDRWMKSKVNLEYIKENGYEYITALNHSELKRKALENKKIQLSLIDKKNLAEFIINNPENWEKTKYILCHNPIKAESDRLNREKLILKTEQDLQKIQNLKRKYDNSEIQNKVSRKINRFRCEKYIKYEIKDGKLSFSRKDEVIENDNKYDWFYMIESTDTEISMESAENRYKSLQYVERAFSEVKNLIKIRPVFHYKESRIKWHIFSCFMSYYVLHKFKEKIEDLLEANSLDSILTELKCIKKTYFKIGKFNFEKLNELNELQKQIFDKYRISYGL